MNRFPCHAAFIVGLLAVGWVGAGYVGTNPLALAITLLIGAFYLLGALELQRFHQATGTLTQAVSALQAPPASLGPWLDQLHPSLQNAVRLRVEGERVGLPGPAITPYLTGLLVLLGMLGTFLGMVVTLNGTGLALQSATDVQAIRASLAAPVKGLGLAFGTSVAGVAASAMLGLMSTLRRRERLLAAQQLDARIATTLRVFSLAHQREESFKLLQLQTQAMPALVDRLQAMMAQMEQQHLALNERLATGQERFHGQAEAAYAGLAASVDRSLKESLADGARAAAAAIQPAMEATMAGLAREAAAVQGSLAQAVQQQLQGLATRFEATTATVAETWKGALAEQQRTSDALAREMRSAHVELQAALAAQDQQRLAAWNSALQAMAASLQHEWQQAGAQTLAQQQQICQTLERTAQQISAQAEAHAGRTIEEIGRLMQAASEAPRAAAEVIAELRQKLSDSLARDNAILEERSRVMETLATLLDAVNHASAEQRGAIEALVNSSHAMLERVATGFAEKVGAEAEKVTDVAAQMTSSAVEVASLGEAFGHAVQLFSESNDKLMAQLQRIEGALGKSIARSDEQLAYYVAQAREVIDLSISSQKQIVEDLQRLSHARAPAASEA